MSEKKTASFTAHLPSSVLAQFKAFAERDGEDVSSLGRQLVYQFLEKERSYYRFSHSVFGSPENYQNSQNS